MRTVHSVAQALEEMSRDGDRGGRWYSRPLAFCLYSSLANQFTGPLKYVCYSPLVVLIAVLVVYLVFLIVFWPLWLLSFIITAYGSLAVFVVLFHFLAVFITRSIAFPGSTSTAQQQISADVVRRVSTYLEGIAASTNEACALLMLVFTGQLGASELQSIQKDLLNIWMSAQYLPNIFFGASQAVEYLKRERCLTPEEVLNMTQLIKGMEEFSSTLQHLLNILTQSDVAKLQDRGLMGRIGRDLPLRAQEFASSAGKCLAASENLRISATTLRPKAGGEDDWDVLGLVKPLLQCTKQLSGYDQIAFPFMRALLQRTYGAKIFSIKGGDDNLVDCLYINAEEAQRIRAARLVGTQRVADTSSAPFAADKLVLFCGPNAGFFETIAQMDYETSWCGYYLSKGMDFFAFNYRGYGRSAGAPTPAALKADAIKVYEYIMKELRPRSVLVHGESIGGMMACHLARSCPVGALLCDRTFGSLDAAARRILAQWAGGGVKYLAWWSTNVVDDFLAVTCPKLIVQDPQDEIIAHPASLKTGIAARLVLRDSALKIHYEPAEYAYARFQQERSLPHDREAAQWLSQGKNSSGPIPQPLVAHLYAACATIAIKFEDTKPKPDAASRSEGGSHRIATEETQGSVQGGGTESLVGESSNLKMLASRFSKQSPAFYSQPMQAAKLGTHARLFQMNLQEEVSISGRPLASYAKVWFALGRVRGAGGQLFNHALCKGLDETVAWVCNYIVWQPPEGVIGGGRSEAGTLRRALQDLNALVQSPLERELAEDSSLAFIIQALDCIEERRDSFWRDRGELGRVDDVEGGASSPVSVSSTHSVALSSSCCARSAGDGAAAKVGELGELVTFTCGHNGWPQAHELERVTAWIAAKTVMMTK